MSRLCLRQTLTILPLLASIIPGTVAAQGLDYGAFEQLFGEPVTESATGKPQRVSDAPVAMDIITAEQIRRSGAHDIPQVLARYTSLDVQQYNAHDYTVGVRGYATAMNQLLLVLVNGRQVFLDNFGYVAWDSIPVQLTEIRQIEVIKGPNSALYGFNAAAGVVNIITYNPLHDTVSNANVRLGTHGYREGSGVVSTRLGRDAGIRLSAGLREEQAWRRGYSEFESQELDARRRPTRAQLAGEVLLRPTDGVVAGLEASYSRAIGGDFYNYGQFWREDKRVWSIRGRLSAETAYGLTEASVYHNTLRATYAVSAHPTDQAITIAQLSHTMKVGAEHTLRPSLEYRRSTQEAVPGQHLGYHVVAIGGMWNWSITDQLESTAAIRYDHLWLGASGFDDPNFPFGDRDYRRHIGRSSWNLGLVWRASANDTVRFGVARGISLPSLADLGYRDSYPEFNYQDTGSPRLSPTVVDDVQLAYRRRVAAIDGHFGVTGFYQRNQGFSSALSVVTLNPPDVPYPTYMPYNLGTSRMLGIELSAAGRWSQALRWGLEYRLAATEASFQPALIEYKRASPRHVVSARLGWTHGPFEADLFGRYASETLGYRVIDVSNTVQQSVSDFVSLAARLSYRLNDRLSLALEGENLLQQYHRQTIALQAERRAYLSLRMDF